MISIKKLLTGNSDESTLRQLVARCLNWFGESAVVIDPHEAENFRNEITALQNAVTPDLPMAEMLIVTGSATQAIETYNKRITRTIGNQAKDLQAVLKLFQEHLTKMAGATSSSVENLSKLGGELERFNGFNDLSSLKIHLAQCLSHLREEVEREKSESKERIASLQVDIEAFRLSNRTKLDSDPVLSRSGSATGLLPQEECVAAIQTALDKGTRHYVLVMVVSRVQQVNARFGRNAGDLMLLRFKTNVESRIVAPDQLFRWTGPAFVAVLERPQPITVVRGLAKRLVETRTEEDFEFSGRPVHIALSATWSVFPLEGAASAIKKQIDVFIASQGQHDLA